MKRKKNPRKNVPPQIVYPMQTDTNIKTDDTENASLLEQKENKKEISTPGDMLVKVFLPLFIGLLPVTQFTSEVKRYQFAIWLSFFAIVILYLLYSYGVKKLVGRVKKKRKWFGDIICTVYSIISIGMIAFIIVHFGYLSFVNNTAVFNAPIAMYKDSDVSNFEFEYIKAPHMELHFEDGNVNQTDTSISYKNISSYVKQYIGKESIVSVPEEYDGYKVRFIADNAFNCEINRNCLNIQHVILPEGIGTIGKHAFYKCYNMKSIVLPTSLLRIEESAFEDCDDLTLIVYDDSYAHDFCLSHNLKHEVILDTSRY